MVYLEILLVVGLVALNGVLAMSELAVVSARTGRLKAMRDRNVPGASTALALAEDPGRFLSTVQVGITLVGILAGAFSGASLGGRLSDWLIAIGLDHALAEPIGFTLVVTAITYVSLVIGELVPKQLALKNPELIACRIAWPMHLLSKLSAPFVFVLDGSGRLLIRLFGPAQSEGPLVTDEEIHAIIAEAESAGVIESGERDMIAGVMRLGDRPVRAMMTPLSAIDMLDVGDDMKILKRKITASRHSRIPVHHGDPEDVIGIVQIKDVADTLMAGKKLDIAKLVRKVPLIPETMAALDAMELFRGSAIHLAFVQNEYGRTLGIITAADLLESIAGYVESDGQASEFPIEREDGTWLLSGSMKVDEMSELLGFPLPPRRQFETVAGLVLDALQHLPSLGQAVVTKGWRFEVVDLDGRRIDKVLASRMATVHRQASRRS